MLGRNPFLQKLNLCFENGTLLLKKRVGRGIKKRLLVRKYLELVICK